MPAELGPSKRLEIWGFQGPRCATIGWRPPIVPFLVVPRNGRATKSQPELARLALRFWQRRSLASISISISICILRQHQPTIKRFPPAGRSLSSFTSISSPPGCNALPICAHSDPLLLATASWPNRHGCNSIDRASFVASSRRPGSRPLEAQLLPPSAELDVAVGCEDTSSRPWISEHYCR